MNVHALYVLTIRRRPVTGANSTIANSDIYDVGCNAVKMDGGNIPSLTAANLLVHNNTLHRFARVTRTRSVGVMWSGCGSVISSNEIFDGPYIGILMNGHGVLTTFEDNHLHDLAQGVADSAGFYAGRTWCDRGNIVRRNRFSRFLATEKLAQSTSVNGIYLDDMESGWVVEDNHFETIHMVSLPLASPSPALPVLRLPSLIGAGGVAPPVHVHRRREAEHSRAEHLRQLHCTCTRRRPRVDMDGLWQEPDLPRCIHAAAPGRSLQAATVVDCIP